ncbi:MULTISPECIES: helix-turn-helix transcriptional regulator [unclassified Pseudoalteromonas]|uniref:helix-turn-helix transcriptional regulator n=1 Tax=unclassified Pseudoalteromonas TaxID=194690 RepID=UPI001F4674E2|nr:MULTISPECIES: AlpA family phage regulatory protein [unclassified Pseudoalteromonas]
MKPANHTPSEVQMYLELIELRCTNTISELNLFLTQITNLKAALKLQQSQFETAPPTPSSISLLEAEKSQVSELVRLQDISRMTGLSRSTIYTMIKEGRFPEGFKLSARAVAWKRADIDNWIKFKSKP